MTEPTVVVGLVTKTHGLRGEVAVEVRSDNADRFSPGSVVRLESGRDLTIEGAHLRTDTPPGAVRGLHDRTTAESLRGEQLLVPVSWLAQLLEGEYWPFQLEG